MSYHRTLDRRDATRPAAMPPIAGVFVGLALCIPFWIALALLLF